MTFLQKQLFAGVLQNRFLKDFAKFAARHLCPSLFFNKAEDSKSTTLSKMGFRLC